MGRSGNGNRLLFRLLSFWSPYLLALVRIPNGLSKALKKKATQKLRSSVLSPFSFTIAEVVICIKLHSKQRGKVQKSGVYIVAHHSGKSRKFTGMLDRRYLTKDPFALRFSSTGELGLND